MASRGCTVPISLLACITETRAVSSVRTEATASAETTPELSTGTSVTRQPRRPRAFMVFSTASCSMAVVTRWRRPAGSRASAAPADCRVVAFRSPGGELDFGRVGPNQVGDLAAGGVENRLGLLAEMVDARGVAPDIPRDLGGQLRDGGVEGGGRIVVEINPHCPLWPDRSIPLDPQQ